MVNVRMGLTNKAKIVEGKVELNWTGGITKVLHSRIDDFIFTCNGPDEALVKSIAIYELNREAISNIQIKF
jgi:hypothetical protein